MKTVLVSGVLFLLSTPAFADPKADLMTTDRAFAHMAETKGYNEAYLAYLAEDGQTFTGDHQINGKADALKVFADPKNASPDPRTNIRTWTPDFAGISADGTLAWTEGHWLHKGPAGNGTGHYMTIWVRERGAWKVRADMGAPDQPKKN